MFERASEPLYVLMAGFGLQYRSFCQGAFVERLDWRLVLVLDATAMDGDRSARSEFGLLCGRMWTLAGAPAVTGCGGVERSEVVCMCVARIGSTLGVSCRVCCFVVRLSFAQSR